MIGPEEIKTPTLGTIFDNSCDSIFVNDNTGTVIMVNAVALRMLGATHQQIVGIKIADLVKKGYYDRSTALEAMQRRSIVTGLVRTAKGINIMSTSTPIFDDDGNLSLVITNSRDKTLIEKFMATLQKERQLTNQYRSQAQYLQRRGLEKDIVAESQIMKELLIAVQSIAAVDSTVLLLGESGTGKEVLAHYIHRCSRRAKEAFIPVDCASIPDHLMESEFFGYVRGAFTGANVQGKPGLFELADKGTLFLDEIAELTLPLQAKLLRVLESQEVRRVGGTKTRKVSIRLICATNKDLRCLVDEGLFRNDLYYRLNVVPVYIPPLRDRPADIKALSEKFLADFNKKYDRHKSLTPQLLNALLQQPWPGNVRELRNVIERFVITNDEFQLYLQQWSKGWQEKLVDTASPHTPVQKTPLPLRTFIAAVEKRYITRVIRNCHGNVSAAARLLGVHRSIIYRKMRSMD